MRVSRAIRSLYFTPRMQLHPARNLVRLGTEYGGWVFQDSPGLLGSVVISAGVGEDASFDVEFASRYGARILLADPTPRAVSHYEGIVSRLGQGRTQPYTRDGCLPLESYDLSGLATGQLTLVAKAISASPGPLRFYAPPNPRHVSHSLINFQQGYSTDTPYIEVDTISMREMWNLAGGRVRLVKLDIEGAEIEAITEMVDEELLPEQLLVEFDELNFPSARATRRFNSAHRALIGAGMRPVHREGRANFLYLQTELLAL